MDAHIVAQYLTSLSHVVETGSPACHEQQCHVVDMLLCIALANRVCHTPEGCEADGSILPLLQMEMPAWITYSDFERAEWLSHLIGALTAHSIAT